MAKARVVWSGNRQIILLPPEFRISNREVEIFRRGDEIILREKPRGMARAFELIAGLPDDFMAMGVRTPRPRSAALSGGVSG
jgi:antitoxin VapB